MLVGSVVDDELGDDFDKLGVLQNVVRIVADPQADPSGDQDAGYTGHKTRQADADVPLLIERVKKLFALLNETINQSKQDAARFAGRHLGDKAASQMRHFQELEKLPRPRFHAVSNLLVRPDADAAEKSRQHGFTSRNLARADSHQIIRHNAKHGAQIEHVPGLLPHQPQRRFRIRQRIEIAGYSLDQSRFAGAIGDDNRNVLANIDVIIACGQIAAGNVANGRIVITRVVEKRHVTTGRVALAGV